jgi:transketolase
MIHDVDKLEEIAHQLRKDTLEMVYKEQSGHIGGSLSMMETMTALYFYAMNYDVQNPQDPNRDRFILSKGHAAPSLYVTLARAGFFPRERLFHSFRVVNGILQGHPDMKKTPGVDMTSGSLGIGLSVACGIALGGKLQGRCFTVYCMMGDGEINEGQIWEAASTAAHYRVGSLIGFVDMNGLQNDGQTIEVKNMGDVPEKWRAFGWHVQEIDGHNMSEILAAIDTAKAVRDQPSIIIQYSVKGKGISFMENIVEWHGDSPNEEQYLQAMKELA